MDSSHWSTLPTLPRKNLMGGDGMHMMLMQRTSEGRTEKAKQVILSIRMLKTEYSQSCSAGHPPYSSWATLVGVLAMKVSGWVRHSYQNFRFRCHAHFHSCGDYSHLANFDDRYRSAMNSPKDKESARHCYGCVSLHMTWGYEIRLSMVMS